MKRLHIHVAVDNLEKSVQFYSSLFGMKPTKHKADYAKWMVEDPRVNFAISARGAKAGIDHLGIQVEAPEELDGLREQMKRADLQLSDEGETTCCYAESDKSWVQDPSGIAWEAYHTMADAEFFNIVPKSAASACCVPKTKPADATAAKTGCC